MPRKRPPKTDQPLTYRASRELEQQKLPLPPKERQLALGSIQLDPTLTTDPEAGVIVGLEGVGFMKLWVLEALQYMLAVTNYEGNRPPAFSSEGLRLPVLEFSPSQLFECMGLPRPKGGYGNDHMAAVTALRGKTVITADGATQRVGGLDSDKFYMYSQPASRGKRRYVRQALFSLTENGSLEPTEDGLTHRTTSYTVTFSPLFLAGVQQGSLNYFNKRADLPSKVAELVKTRSREGVLSLALYLTLHASQQPRQVAETVEDLAYRSGVGFLLQQRKRKAARQRVAEALNFMTALRVVDQWSLNDYGHYDLTLTAVPKAGRLPPLPDRRPAETADLLAGQPLTEAETADLLLLEDQRADLAKRTTPMLGSAGLLLTELRGRAADLFFAGAVPAEDGHTNLLARALPVLVEDPEGQRLLTELGAVIQELTPLLEREAATVLQIALLVEGRVIQAAADRIEAVATAAADINVRLTMLEDLFRSAAALADLGGAE